MNRSSLPEPETFTVPEEMEAVRAARRRIVRIVRTWWLPLSRDALADVELLAGEIVGNAARHSGAACTVAVRWTGRRLRVEVSDSSPRPPFRVNRPSTQATSGRGLALVDALAYAWGWETRQNGKTVWFEVAADAAVVSPARMGTRACATAPARSLTAGVSCGHGLSLSVAVGRSR